MNILSRQQQYEISGGVHWIPNRHGGFSAPGSQALESIAAGNGGKIPTSISADGIGIVSSAVLGALGVMFGPAGAALGTMVGQGIKYLTPVIKEATNQSKQ